MRQRCLRSFTTRPCRRHRLIDLTPTKKSERAGGRAEPVLWLGTAGLPPGRGPRCRLPVSSAWLDVQRATGRDAEVVMIDSWSPGCRPTCHFTTSVCVPLGEGKHDTPTKTDYSILLSWQEIYAERRMLPPGRACKCRDNGQTLLV